MTFCAKGRDGKPCLTGDCVALCTQEASLPGPATVLPIGIFKTPAPEEPGDALTLHLPFSFIRDKTEYSGEIGCETGLRE